MNISEFSVDGLQLDIDSIAATVLYLLLLRKFCSLVTCDLH